MDKWEYWVVESSKDGLQTTLNQLGSQGWEAVHLSISGASGNGFGNWNQNMAKGELRADKYTIVLKRRTA